MCAILSLLVGGLSESRVDADLADSADFGSFGAFSDFGKMLFFVPLDTHGAVETRTYLFCRKGRMRNINYRVGGHETT